MVTGHYFSFTMNAETMRASNEVEEMRARVEVDVTHASVDAREMSSSSLFKREEGCDFY